MPKDCEYPRKYRHYFNVPVNDGECVCFIDILQTSANDEQIMERGAIQGNKVTNPEWLKVEIEREMNNKPKND